MDWQSTLRTQYKISDFITWKQEKGLILNPNFQRRPVWKKGAKSYLMDTIVRGLPVPIIFLRDMASDLKTFKARRDVVDGQQRLRTIFSFINPSLVDDYKPEKDEFTISRTHNSDLGGLPFDQLPGKYQQRILDYQFSVHIFSADTDDREILQIFARMNSTGVKANAQELRNAEFFGKFKTQAYALAAEQLNRWREWKIFNPDQIARMNEVELTSEFMLLIINGVMEKKNKTIDEGYRDFNSKYPFRKEVARRFRHVFDAIETAITTKTVSQCFNTRTTFYALFAAIYGYQFEIRKQSSNPAPLEGKVPRRLTNDVIQQIKTAGQQFATRELTPRVLKALRGATTDASERRTLIRHIMGKDHDPCRAPR